MVSGLFRCLGCLVTGFSCVALTLKRVTIDDDSELPVASLQVFCTCRSERRDAGSLPRTAETATDSAGRENKRPRCCFSAVTDPVHNVLFLWQVSSRKWAGSGTGSSDLTIEEERGDTGPNGGSGETETKRARVDRWVRVYTASAPYRLQCLSCIHSSHDSSVCNLQTMLVKLVEEVPQCCTSVMAVIPQCSNTTVNKSPAFRILLYKSIDLKTQTDLLCKVAENVIF